MQLSELRSATYQLLVAILVLLPNASFGDNVAPNAPSNQAVRSKHLADNEYRFASALHVIAVKCLSCHRPSGGASDFTAYMPAETLWVNANLIVPKQAQNSILYKYLVGSGFSPAPLGTMPLGAPFPASELAIIRDWINQIENPIAVPTPIPTEPGSGAGVGLNPLNAAPRLGDRNYIASVLNQVFGPGALTTTTTQIQNLVSIFGGACDPMAFMPPNGQGATTCPGLDAQVYGGPILPLDSTSRAGQTAKVCNVLSFNNTTLQFAIRAATQTTDLTYLGANPLPTRDQILSAYRLFSPGAPAPDSVVIDNLVALAQATVDNRYPNCPTQNTSCQLDPWRYVMLALCYDPEWQVN